MPEVDIQVLEKKFYLKKPFLKHFCKSVIQAAWGEEDEPAEVSLVLCDDEFIRKLNREYRGKNKATNVLSFEGGHEPAEGQPWVAGDIVISYQTVLKEAQEQKKSFAAHFAHMMVHGVLHLLGEDHLTEKQAKSMESQEIEIMKQLGYRNPYDQIDA